MTDPDDLIELDLEACTAARIDLALDDPDDPAVQQVVIDAYRARILDPASNTQEMLVYLDQMGAARALQMGAEPTPDRAPDQG
jgi:hypothetical protein